MPCGKIEKGDGIAGWGECVFTSPAVSYKENRSNLDGSKEGVLRPRRT